MTYLAIFPFFFGDRLALIRGILLLIIILLLVLFVFLAAQRPTLLTPAKNASISRQQERIVPSECDLHNEIFRRVVVAIVERLEGFPGLAGLIFVVFAALVS